VENIESHSDTCHVPQNVDSILAPPTDVSEPPESPRVGGLELKVAEEPSKLHVHND